MGNINFKTCAKFIAALLALAYLTACGSSVSGSGFGSTSSASLGGTPIAGAAIAKCSKDMGNLSDFQVRVEAAYDQFGTLQPSYARVAIAASPSDWSTSNYDLQLYRWTVSSTGVPMIDHAALGFQFERTVAPGNYQLLSGSTGAPTYTIVNATEITQYAQAAGLANYSSAQAVLSGGTHFLVNLNDLSGSYQVIRAVLYVKGTGTVYRQVDTLIPLFYANPATYNAQLNSAGAAAHPAILQALHPLQSMIGQGWAESQYQSFMNNFCF